MAEEYLTDDEQWDAIKRGIAENGVWIVAGVVLGAALLFGWRYYQGHRDDVALKAAAQFGQMTAALEGNDRNKARATADGLIKDFPTSPYADQARLTIARLFVDDGQEASAIAPLTQVMDSSKDGELKHIARLRLARVLIDQGKADEAVAALGADTPGAFAARFHEVRGDALYAKKDFKGALSEYQAAIGTGDTAGVDTALLELKIADLNSSSTVTATSAPATASTHATASGPTSTPSSSNKAKP